jgi:small conductance mechanosensitive channel
VILVVCAVIIKLLTKGFDRAIDKFNVERSLHTFLKSVIRVLLWFITILIVAGLLGIPTSSLIAVLSVAGLAISLSIQGTLSNLAAGIMLLISKPFKVSDYIEAGGVSGVVSDIGLVYTTVTTFDNKMVFVPNNEISGGKITNYTAATNRRVDLTFSTSYEAKPADVKCAILSVIQAHPKTMFTPEPFVGVSAYQDSCIDYSVRVWCATEDFWTVYYDLLEQVKTAFDQNGIEMTYNHLNVHLMKE